ncbi:MAG: hypothetical protein WCV62_06765 [Candidatus Peribacteraceae bacterium]|jgi:hypothetical protein
MKKLPKVEKLKIMLEAVQFAIDVSELAPADWYNPELPAPFRVKEKEKRLNKLRNRLNELRAEYRATLN